MNTNITTETEKLHSIINPILDNTLSTVMGMQLGDRIGMKELAERVGKATNMQPSIVLPLVNFFTHNMPTVAYVSPGRTGGVVRGERGETKITPPTTETTETTTENQE